MSNRVLTGSILGWIKADKEHAANAEARNLAKRTKRFNKKWARLVKLGEEQGVEVVIPELPPVGYVPVEKEIARKVAVSLEETEYKLDQLINNLTKPKSKIEDVPTYDEVFEEDCLTLGGIQWVDKVITIKGGNV